MNNAVGISQALAVLSNTACFGLVYSSDKAEAHMQQRL